MASGITDSSLEVPLWKNAKAHGVTQKGDRGDHHPCGILCQAGLKGWAVFNLAKKYGSVNEGDLPYEDEAMRAHAKEMVFPDRRTE